MQLSCFSMHQHCNFDATLVLILLSTLVLTTNSQNLLDKVLRFQHVSRKLPLHITCGSILANHIESVIFSTVNRFSTLTYISINYE